MIDLDRTKPSVFTSYSTVVPVPTLQCSKVQFEKCRNSLTKKRTVPGTCIHTSYMQRKTCRQSEATAEAGGASDWPDGDTYVGEYQDDKMHGQGVYTYSNNEQQKVGLFCEGMFMGD